MTVRFTSGEAVNGGITIRPIITPRVKPRAVEGKFFIGLPNLGDLNIFF